MKKLFLAVALSFALPLAAAAPEGDLSLSVGLNNPFNPSAGESTRFDFFTHAPGNLRLEIYTADGRFVVRVADLTAAADSAHQQLWNGSNDAGSTVDAGVYFVILSGTGRRVIRRVVVKRG